MDGLIKLKATNISKTFVTSKDEIEALKDISLDVRENEFLVILGPGQSGKSVFINIISGLMQPTTGFVEIDGEESSGISDKISIVFQRVALMPWKTTIENVEMGLKFQGIPKDERRKTAQHYIDMVGLEGFENSYPSQLSGGMKQRVGIARAYASNPQILLMDEPFGALDAQTRYSMQSEILTLWENDKKTVIFITNNIEEAIYLGDRIVLFSERPAIVKAEYDLSTLTRPRDYVSREFLETRRIIESNTDLSL